MIRPGVVASVLQEYKSEGKGDGLCTIIRKMHRLGMLTWHEADSFLNEIDRDLKDGRLRYDGWGEISRGGMYLFPRNSFDERIKYLESKL
jgi:hypothetical protein